MLTFSHLTVALLFIVAVKLVLLYFIVSIVLYLLAPFLAPIFPRIFPVLPDNANGFQYRYRQIAMPSIGTVVVILVLLWFFGFVHIA